MTAPATPPVAILGAGPAGLTLARILTLNSIPYTIFERDVSQAASAQWSGSLDIHHDSGQLALKDAGVLDAFKRIARYDAQAMKLMDKNGEMALDIGDPESEGRPEIDRSDLRRLLLGAVPSQAVRWGSKVAKVEQTDDGMTVSLANGAVEKGFRLVVGADGAWSKARSLVTSAKPKYYGHISFTTSISLDNPYHATVKAMVGPGMYFACGNAKQIIAQGVADGSYQINIGVAKPEHWSKSSEGAALVADPPAFREHLLEQFPDWSSTVTDLVRNSDGAFRPWPLYALPVESMRWESVPGLTLLGDAAHLNIPDGGGVNRALRDAAELARRIVSHGIDNLDAAVKEYEAEMLPRSKAEIEASKFTVELLWSEGAPTTFVDAVMAGGLE